MRQAEGFVIIPRNRVNSVQVDRPGDFADVSFVLDNVTNRPVVVLGAETSCDCTTLQGLPITIPARGESSLRFRLTTTPARSWQADQYNDQIAAGHSFPGHQAGDRRRHRECRHNRIWFARSNRSGTLTRSERVRTRRFCVVDSPFLSVPRLN